MLILHILLKSTVDVPVTASSSPFELLDLLAASAEFASKDGMFSYIGRPVSVLFGMYRIIVILFQHFACCKIMQTKQIFFLIRLNCLLIRRLYYVLRVL